MKHVLLFAAIALSACAPMHVEPGAAPPPPPPPAAPVVPPPSRGGLGGADTAPADCALTIGFASYGAGIDAATRTRVEALLAGDRAVTGFQAHRWGREGEVTLCVRTRAPADAARLFQSARALVPARPRGPIQLRTLSGLSYETAAPR